MSSKGKMGTGDPMGGKKLGEKGLMRKPPKTRTRDGVPYPG